MSFCGAAVESDSLAVRNHIDSDTFVAVAHLLNSCTARKDSDFCEQKLTPGISPATSSTNSNGGASNGSPSECSPSETMKGSDAVLTFAECTPFDQVSMLVTNYDENKFGPLDQFETCAHSFSLEDDHGGHTALGCMEVLVNAIAFSDESTDENAKAVAALASSLYRNAGEFCECASQASADCPLCSSFIHIKTLLYEAMDACKALDEIDCDAWTEYYKPCKTNLISRFGSADLSQDEACEYLSWLTRQFIAALMCLLLGFQADSFEMVVEEESLSQPFVDWIVQMKQQRKPPRLRGISTTPILTNVWTITLSSTTTMMTGTSFRRFRSHHGRHRPR